MYCLNVPYLQTQTIIVRAWQYFSIESHNATLSIYDKRISYSDQVTSSFFRDGLGPDDYQLL